MSLPRYFEQSKSPRHHQGIVLMRDNPAVNITIPIAPKIEMATSNKQGANFHFHMRSHGPR